VRPGHEVEPHELQRLPPSFDALLTRQDRDRAPSNFPEAFATGKGSAVRKRMALVLAACAGLVFAPIGPVSAAPEQLTTKVVKAGPKAGGGEPSIAIARDNTMYVSYPGNAMNMVVSTDRGKTWTGATSPEKP